MRAPTGTLLRAGVAIILGLAVVSCTDDPEPGTIESPSRHAVVVLGLADAQHPRGADRGSRPRLLRRTHHAPRRPTTPASCADGHARVVRASAPFEASTRREPAGRTTPDATWSVDSLRVHDIEGETGLAEVEYTVSAYDVLNAKGKVIADYPETQSHVDLSLVQRRWQGGSSATSSTWRADEHVYCDSLAYSALALSASRRSPPSRATATVASRSTTARQTARVRGRPGRGRGRHDGGAVPGGRPGQQARARRPRRTRRAPTASGRCRRRASPTARRTTRCA